MRHSLRTTIAASIFSLLLPVAASAGGTIEGKVIYTGKPGRNPLINMGADPNCLSINAGQKVQQEMVSLHDDGSVGNVFVHITDEVPGAAAPSTPVEIDQRGCIYHPRISGAVTGQTLLIRNNDATLHNIHTTSEAGNSFNVGQPKAGMEHTHNLRGTEIMLRLKCDVHPWMVGYLGVKSHPHFAVSGDGGSFRIENVPAGTYNLQAWQERLGTRDQSITVADGETVTVTFEYGAPQKKSSVHEALPVRDFEIHGDLHATDE